jgi:hypothetical protein
MRTKQLALGLVMLGAIAVPAGWAASPLIQAFETSINLDANFMHTQYHENLSPIGDDESGFTEGAGVTIGSLLPLKPGYSPDLYTYLGYNINAGNIHYGGYFQDGTPLAATDHAVFQNIEARIGAGFPLADGSELIPFIAGGYQAWNRNVDGTGVFGGGEFYHSGLFGAGLRYDYPVSPTVVVSGTAEILGLAGGGVHNPSINFGRGFGVTPEEHLEFEVSDQISPRWHVFGTGFFTHFNYSGTHPEYFPYYYVYEPQSVTTQYGFSIGFGYSFD